LGTFIYAEKCENQANVHPQQETQEGGLGWETTTSQALMMGGES
jgi:hypothetical protein